MKGFRPGQKFYDSWGKRGWFEPVMTVSKSMKTRVRFYYIDNWGRKHYKTYDREHIKFLKSTGHLTDLT